MLLLLLPGAPDLRMHFRGGVLYIWGSGHKPNVTTLRPVGGWSCASGERHMSTQLGARNLVYASLSDGRFAIYTFIPVCLGYRRLSAPHPNWRN